MADIEVTIRMEQFHGEGTDVVEVRAESRSLEAAVQIAHERAKAVGRESREQAYRAAREPSHA